MIEANRPIDMVSCDGPVGYFCMAQQSRQSIECYIADVAVHFFEFLQIFSLEVFGYAAIVVPQ
jgi:hypothetical protein